MRANERTDERVAQYLRLDFCLFQTTVHGPADIRCDRLVAYSVVARLESEREALLGDRQRLTAEREALSAEKEAAVKLSAEREAGWGTKIVDLETKIDREVREKENLSKECHHLRDTLQTMRQHMQTMEQQVQLSVPLWARTTKNTD